MNLILTMLVNPVSSQQSHHKHTGISSDSHMFAMGLLQCSKVYMHGQDYLHGPPVVALRWSLRVFPDDQDTFVKL